LLGFGPIRGASIEVEIRDQTPFHVFRANEPFAFDILTTITSGEATGDLAYQWRDFRGDPLGPIVPLTIGTRTQVKSPSDSPFGIIHADLDDPHLPTWVKTMSWNTTHSKVVAARNAGPTGQRISGAANCFRCRVG
jgi:hypothetical protein